MKASVQRKIRQSIAEEVCHCAAPTVSPPIGMSPARPSPLLLGILASAPHAVPACVGKGGGPMSQSHVPLPTPCAVPAAGAHSGLTAAQEDAPHPRQMVRHHPQHSQPAPIPCCPVACPMPKWTISYLLPSLKGRNDESVGLSEKHMKRCSMSPPVPVGGSQNHINLVVINQVPLFFNIRDGPYMPTLRLLHQCQPPTPHAHLPGNAARSFCCASRQPWGPHAPVEGLTHPGQALGQGVPCGREWEGASPGCPLGVRCVRCRSWSNEAHSSGPGRHQVCDVWGQHHVPRADLQRGGHGRRHPRQRPCGQTPSLPPPPSLSPALAPSGWGSGCLWVAPGEEPGGFGCSCCTA